VFSFRWGSGVCWIGKCVSGKINEMRALICDVYRSNECHPSGPQPLWFWFIYSTHRLRAAWRGGGTAVRSIDGFEQKGGTSGHQNRPLIIAQTTCPALPGSQKHYTPRKKKERKTDRKTERERRTGGIVVVCPQIGVQLHFLAVGVLLTGLLLGLCSPHNRDEVACVS
jgi:hypothetical protein